MLSLYFHIPFCTRKCPYCHFFVLKDDQAKRKEFLTSLKKEWDLKKGLIKDPIASIYFGGGTPSKLTIEELQEIFSWFSDLHLEKNCEITLEANPEDLSKEYIQGLLDLKINRLSIGIQTLDDTLLSSLKRTHDAQMAKKAIILANSLGFDNISIDLMYDLPNQSLSSFSKTLEELNSLPITHLSLYNLIFEKNSLFYKKKKQILPLLPSQDDSLAMIHLAEKTLDKMGLKRYEISAFAKDNKISIHNTGYWTARPFIGYGPSAFSYLEGARIKNIENLSKYSSLLNENKDPIEFEEKLSLEEKQKELFAVELRMFKGILLSEFEQKHGKLFPTLKKSIKELINDKLIEHNEGIYQLSQRGVLFYDTVGQMLI